jgi:hypothetical protein
MDDPAKDMRIHRYKLRGEALVTTLVVSLVVLCLCAAMLFLLYFFNILRIKDRDAVFLDDGVYSAVNYTLASAGYPTAVISADLDLSDNTRDTVRVTRGPWGCYVYGLVEAKNDRAHLRRALLYGGMQAPGRDRCLYVADHNEPLALVGNTLIDGNATLPRAGVRQGYVDQRGYAGNILVTGSVDTSQATLPALDGSFTNFCTWLAGLGRDSTIGYTPLPGDPVRRSFFDSVMIFKQKGLLSLSGVKLSGRVVIASDSVVEVSSDASLDNVLIAAPVVLFKPGFHGAVQVFARDSIVVGQGCHFTYPSALVVMPGARAQTESDLNLDRDVVIDGVVIAASGSPKSPQTRLRIHDEASVNGLVYCNGYCYLQGQVTGAVFTDFFLYAKGPSVFDNMLVDAQVRAAAPAFMPGSYSALGQTGKNVLLEWLP